MSKSIGMSLVKTRDGATAILRKLGIKPRDYDFFIEKLADGCLAVQTHKAKAHLAALAADAPAPRTGKKLPRGVPASSKPKAPRAPRPAGAPRRVGRGRPADPASCSSVARAMIRAGKSNAEVWEVIKAQFNLDDGKKHYPSWYRSDMKKRGEPV